MAHQTGILEAVQDYGFVLGKKGYLGLIEYAGWRTRGSSTFNPKGSTNHHTAGSRNGLLPSLATLVYGRSGLPGPLCNAALARDASLWLIAAGRANHAGRGGWRGLSGNSSVWGLEVEHIGYASEPVTDEQWEAMYRWHAACADFSGFPAQNVHQHFEWAPDRKIDFVKPVTNGGTFRNQVNIRLERRLPPVVETPEPVQEDDDMLHLVQGDKTPEWWFTDMVNGRRHVKSTAQAARVIWNTVANGGKVATNKGAPIKYPEADLATLPIVGKAEAIETSTDLTVKALKADLAKLTADVKAWQAALAEA